MPHTFATPSFWKSCLSPHSPVFAVAFVIANIAALGLAYAAAHAMAPEATSPRMAHDGRAVHHVGRMALVPLAPTTARR